MKKIVSLLLCLLLAAEVMGGCAVTQPEPEETQTQAATEPTVQTEPPRPDTLTVTIPDGEHGLMMVWLADFQKLHPHLTVELKREPVEKYRRHLLVDVREGEGPDLALVNARELGTFVQMGVGVDLSLYLSAERLADYDSGPLSHMSEDGVVYGLPVYAQVWGLGGSRELLEAAGVDIEGIQARGWDYPQFLEAMAAGTVERSGSREKVWGFAFPNSEDAVERFIRSFGAGAGLCHDFTRDCRYTMTSQNMLEFLQMAETMMESGDLYTEQTSWEKCIKLGVSGKVTMAGCVTPLVEELVRRNNAALEAGSRDAIHGSRQTEFVFLPAPYMPGFPETSCGTVVGFMAIRNRSSTEEHLANTAMLLDFLSSGSRAADCVDFWYLEPLCQSGREAVEMDEGRDPANMIAATRSASFIAPPAHDVSRSLRENADAIMDTIIAPGFLRLRSTSMTAQKLYDQICKAAFENIGRENCITDRIPME